MYFIVCNAIYIVLHTECAKIYIVCQKPNRFFISAGPLCRLSLFVCLVFAEAGPDVPHAGGQH